MSCLSKPTPQPAGAPLGIAGGALLPAARVVVVEDDPDSGALLEALLRSAGVVEVQVVTDPRQAVAHCLEIDPDLVMLDLHMPRMDGFAVLAELVEVLPEPALLPVLVLTADSDPEARNRALRAGAKDFLTKPLDVEEVVLRVRNLLETRALHASLQRHNDALRQDLDMRVAQERRDTALRQQRRERIDAVLADGGPTMVFQPIVELHTGAILGVEALARFNTEPRRPPNEWFDEAASVDRGIELELAAAAAALARLDSIPDGQFLAINLSPNAVLATDLLHLLEHHPAGRLVLELTEHSPVEDYEHLLQALAPLRRRGVRIAVDDAGAGYAGLRHVLRLQPELIKLDITLTSGIDQDPAKAALAAAMVTFAREVGAIIVAEGIETDAEQKALRRLGIGWGQGYHLARPGPLL